MAEITIRRLGEIVRKVFEILMRHSEGVAAHQVLETVEKEMALTAFEKSTYPNRPTVKRFEKIVRFATIGPVKAGWMVKDKGQWMITDEGRKAYKNFPDPAEFRREASRLYYEWKKGQPENEGEIEDESAETPGASTTLEEAEEGAWAEIESHLAKMNPYDFQALVAGLLEGMGYHVAWNAPVGPDKGIDIIAYNDPLGIEGGRIKVQVKRRQDKIAVPEVRSFLATLGDHDIGLFVTTAGFTSESELEARVQEKRRLMLLDAKKLFELWVKHYKQIPEEQRRLLPIRPVWYLTPEE